MLTRTATLLSEDNVHNVTDIIRNVRNSSETFPELVRNTDDLLKEGRNAMDRFNATLIRLDELTQNLQKITKPLADRSDSLARNLDEGLARFNHTLVDVNQLVEAIGQSDGTLNKLLTDPSLYNHLDEVACQAAKAAPQLSQIMKDVETFTDKLARHPEPIGLGGAGAAEQRAEGPADAAGLDHSADAPVTMRRLPFQGVQPSGPFLVTPEKWAAGIVEGVLLLFVSRRTH